MPHDMHGRLIEKGDVVAAPAFYDRPKQAARVAFIYEGSDTCNLQVETFYPRDGRPTVTAKESELLLKHDGSIPELPAVPPQGQPEVAQ